MSVDNNIIFTTAFKYINRNNWHHYQRSTQQYFNGFLNLATHIPYKLIVYVEDSIKEQLIQKRDFNSNIIFVDLNSVDTFYNKFLEKDKTIMESSIYQEKIPDDRKINPEHIYSDYNLINHSKINFVRNTKSLFPNYSFYAWIDFGGFNNDTENIPKSLNTDLLPKKIIYQCINHPPGHRIDEDEMLASHTIFFAGSTFIVYTDLVETFEELWGKKIAEWQERYVSDDDQNLILQLYFDSPHLFHKIIYWEWYSLYKLLQNKT